MEISQEQLNEAVKAALADATELHILRAKKALTTAQVQKLYGISKARLDKMRLDGTGPKYSKPTAGNRDTNTSSVFYRHEDVEAWLAAHEIHPM